MGWHWKRGSTDVYGTGSVGYALKAHKNIISNDLEYYAYIINHAILEEDKMSDQISIKEFIDPFTGSKNPKALNKNPLRGSPKKECGRQTFRAP